MKEINVSLANELTKEFLSILFDSEEHTCFSKTPYGTRVLPINYFGKSEFFCINPLKPKSTRADSNVIKFRNILVEMDQGSLEEQAHLIENVVKLPYSTKVYSGSKSLHYILSIEDFGPGTREEYNELVLDIFAAIPGCDPSVKNPSRFSRLGDAFRTDTQKLQEVLDLKGRIKISDVMDFLHRNSSAVEEQKAKRESLRAKFASNLIASSKIIDDSFRGDLTKKTKDFLKFGAPKGERNPTLYFAACDFKNNCYTLEEALDKLGTAARSAGLSDFETNSVIQSAYSRAGFRPRVWEGKRK